MQKCHTFLEKWGGGNEGGPRYSLHSFAFHIPQTSINKPEIWRDEYKRDEYNPLGSHQGTSQTNELS